MLKKDEILKKYKTRYKPAFLLAWGRFLTYDELVSTDNTEILEKESMMENGSEWDKNVLPYTERNIKNALCIAVDVAVKDINFHNGMSYLLYYDDVCEWLKILENNDIPFPKRMSENAFMMFYRAISDYYGFNLF